MVSGDDAYEVGYKKPPADTRFKKGQSGNPSGRRKGTRDFKTDMREGLDEQVGVREGGVVKNMSTQEAAIKRLRVKALEGDQRALERLLEYAERYGVEEADDAAEAELSGEDQAIIDRFVDRAIAMRTAASEAKKPCDDEADDE